MSIGFDLHFTGGPQPNYSLYHVWKCYHTLEEQGPIGRRSLTKVLGIGEGSTRTMLKWMTKEECIDSTPRGEVLLPRGREKLASVGIKIINLTFIELSIGRFNCSVLVKGMASKVRLGTEQHDDSVRAGANSAITLVRRNGKIVFPGDERYPRQDLMEPVGPMFGVEEGDAIIIGGASSYEMAEKGAVSAALALIQSESRDWNESTRMLSRDYEDEDVKTIALAIHELVGRLPVTMRTKNHYGVRCEDGKIIESNFTGPVLEETLRRGKIVRRIAKGGKYRGVPVLAVPFVRNKETIAVVGVFDTTRGSYYEWLGKVKK
jgi:hypothetical protein